MTTATNPLLFAGFLLMACTGSTAESTENHTITSSVSVEVPPAVDTVSLPAVLPQYTWQETYDPKDALALRIQTPIGFSRIDVSAGSFAEWLRFLPLHPDDHPVMLYNGALKGNQRAHRAVIQLDVGTRDLQQCADAVMRLKSEYHYSREEYTAIHFSFSDGSVARFSDWAAGNRIYLNNDRWRQGSGNGPVSPGRSNFHKYLNLVFGYAGTATLEKELDPIAPFELQAGDVFIQGGHPGHAILVLDVAENAAGEKLFLLGQSYMPAQEFHLLRNPAEPDLSPWYRLVDQGSLRTPEWTFTFADLHRFPPE